MEELNNKKSSIKRAKKKKATVNETSHVKQIQINLPQNKRSNSEKTKNMPNKF